MRLFVALGLRFVFAKTHNIKGVRVGGKLLSLIIKKLILLDPIWQQETTRHLIEKSTESISSKIHMYHNKENLKWNTHKRLLENELSKTIGVTSKPKTFWQHHILLETVHKLQMRATRLISFANYHAH